MKLYFAEVDEYSLLYSFKHECFFSNHPFTALSEHDVIIYLTEKKIAGIATLLKENNLTFSHIYLHENRTPLVGMIRNLLNHEWGTDIETKIETFQPLESSTVKHLLKELEKLDCSLAYFLTEIDYLLEEAEKNKEKIERFRSKEKIQQKVSALQENASLAKDASTHTKIQFYLKEIGKITNCDVWTASNDKNRTFKGQRLGENDLSSFMPTFSMDEEAKKRLGLIDTTWFDGDQPLATFEVECTTSVYSGILRMADFLSVMPTRDIKLYVVAPEERKEKVMKELNRPIFKHIGLHQICKFISLESLEVLYKKIQGLQGYVKYDVVDVIALNIEELEITSAS